jgi:mannose-6-phosphate isomerase
MHPPYLPKIDRFVTLLNILSLFFNTLITILYSRSGKISITRKEKRGNMPNLYPLLFEPVLKHYIWGGRNLEKLGRVLPEKGKVAESWEIAAHEDGMVLVKNGTYAGKELGNLLEMLGEDLVGSNNQWALDRGKFPLLVKLIDANKNLSVQVHPDDSYARKHEGNELGKSEMWVVLDAKPDAEIIYGLNEQVNKESFRNAIENGDLGKYLQRVQIKPGDHVCVPSNTLHAILEGALIAEIQQNSNTTYRVYDWNRVGDDGKPRELHIDKALDVINFDQVGFSLSKPEPKNGGDGWSVEGLCQNQYFTTDRYQINKGAVVTGLCDGTTLEIWGILSGSVEIKKQRIDPVTFVLLPAALGEYKIKAIKDSTLLRTYVE